MERFAMNSLEEWKNKDNRKPMIIRGARQVGKTWLMKEFAKNIPLHLPSELQCLTTEKKTG